MAWNRYKARAIWQKRRERAAKGGKYMQARRPDICETCRGKIDAGNTIFWQPSPTGRGHVYCEPCARAAGMTTGGAPANDQSAGATSHQAPATATSTDTAATTGNTAEHQTAPTFNTPDTLPTFTKEELIEKIQNQLDYQKNPHLEVIGMNKKPPTQEELNQLFFKLIEEGLIKEYYRPVLTPEGEKVLDKLTNKAIFRKLNHYSH